MAHFYFPGFCSHLKLKTSLKIKKLGEWGVRSSLLHLRVCIRGQSPCLDSPDSCWVNWIHTNQHGESHIMKHFPAWSTDVLLFQGRCHDFNSWAGGGCSRKQMAERPCALQGNLATSGCCWHIAKVQTLEVITFPSAQKKQCSGLKTPCLGHRNTPKTIWKKIHKMSDKTHVIVVVGSKVLGSSIKSTNELLYNHIKSRVSGHEYIISWILMFSSISRTLSFGFNSFKHSSLGPNSQ